MQWNIPEWPIGAHAADTPISLVVRHERGLPGQATTLMVEGQWNKGRSFLIGGVVAPTPGSE